MRYRIELTYRNKTHRIRTIEARSDADAWRKAELRRPLGGTVLVLGRVEDERSSERT